MPRVSVVLPVRDAAGTLSSAIRSVRRQSLADLECIVVDDGSTDGSADVAARHAEDDARVRLLRRPAEGVAAAANAGVRAAASPLVARMDADDLMRRERLAEQVATLAADPSLVGVGSHVRLFPRAALGGGMRAYEAWLNGLATSDDVRRDRYVECPLANPSLMLRREVLLEHPWRARGWPEDYDLVLGLLRRGHRLGVVPRRLLSWRHAPGRLTTDHPDYALDRFTACRAHHLARDVLRHVDRYVLWGYGDTGRQLRRALLEHGKEPSHVVEVHPGRIGQVIHGAPVVPPSDVPTLPRLPILVSVAGAGPRAKVREALAAMEFVEDVDFVCTA